MLATLSSPGALLSVSHSTPLPCLALPRARRGRREQDSIAFPEPNYVLAPAEPKHLPVNAGKNGSLRLSLDDIKSALGAVQAQPEPARPKSSTMTHVRKKSGELVKPSLKHAHTLSGALPTQKSLSRSAPATPTTPKFVHFDAQLEHVRLFLAEQKPTAVSRGGSPTETSEGEGNEFPWHGRNYNSSDDERIRKALRIKNTNLPARPALDQADVKVESLTLAEDGSSLVGRVLVRNIAFEKWVAARFTFDWWQTTSEVSARYVETVSEGVDRFAFTIKLGDVLHRIEEKTLFIAVRYTVGGREIWDSNNGQNYMVSFTKEKPANNWSGWSAKSRPRDPMGDLRKSLERAIQDEDDDSLPTLQIKSRPRANVRGMSFSGFEAKKPTVESIVEPKPTKFSARYDFGAAAREGPFKPAEFKPATVEFKPSRPKVSTEVRPIADAKLCESPRDADDTIMRVQLPTRSNGLELPTPSEPVPVPLPGRRHHHRAAAYFDAWTFPAPGVKRTSPGAPATEEDLGIPASWMAGELGGDSVASTPSVTSSSSPSQSPSSPPEFLPSPESEIDMGNTKDMDPTNYSSFLDRFCFFTGPAESDYAMFGGYSDATARTLRAVSSSLSNTGSDASAANTPRAGSPAASCASSSPRSRSPIHV